MESSGKCRLRTAWCSNLASSRLRARSSHCSDTVSSSCSRAMALSTELCGAKPTPWSISLLMVSKHRLSGRLLACCTASSQRACSSLSLSRGSCGSSTSRPRLMSSRSCSSTGLGDSSESRRSLRCWKSSTRVNRSWRSIYKRHSGTAYVRTFQKNKHINHEKCHDISLKTQIQTLELDIESNGTKDEYLTSKLSCQPSAEDPVWCCMADYPTVGQKTSVLLLLNHSGSETFLLQNDT